MHTKEKAEILQIKRATYFSAKNLTNTNKISFGCFTQKFCDMATPRTPGATAGRSTARDSRRIRDGVGRINQTRKGKIAITVRTTTRACKEAIVSLSKIPMLSEVGTF
jgi:hypothetical protein